MLEITPAIYRTENPENPKSLKKRSLAPPRPRTPKKSKKSPKSQEKRRFSDNFLTFRTFFGLFRGPGSGGPKLLSGDFCETFRVFGVFGSVDGGGNLNAMHPNPSLTKPVIHHADQPGHAAKHTGKNSKHTHTHTLRAQRLN